MTIQSHEVVPARYVRTASYRLVDGREVEDLHPDCVAELEGILSTYQGRVPDGDVIAHIVVGLRAWRERQAAAERRAARIADIGRGVRAAHGGLS